MLKLDIGSGDSPIDGYIGVDFYAHAAVKNHMWDLRDFGDLSVDCIYSSHALEHIERFRVLDTLKEWYRVLKFGGTLELRVPNILWCLKHYMDYVRQNETPDNPVLGWELSIIIGSQEPGSEGMVHKMAFTPNSVVWFVRQAGFKDIVLESLWTHSQETLCVKAVKR